MSPLSVNDIPLVSSPTHYTLNNSSIRPTTSNISHNTTNTTTTTEIAYNPTQPIGPLAPTLEYIHPMLTTNLTSSNLPQRGSVSETYANNGSGSDSEPTNTKPPTIIEISSDDSEETTEDNNDNNDKDWESTCPYSSASFDEEEWMDHCTNNRVDMTPQRSTDGEVVESIEPADGGWSTVAEFESDAPLEGHRGAALTGKASQDQVSVIDLVSSESHGEIEVGRGFGVPLEEEEEEEQQQQQQQQQHPPQKIEYSDNHSCGSDSVFESDISCGDTSRDHDMQAEIMSAYDLPQVPRTAADIPQMPRKFYELEGHVGPLSEIDEDDFALTFKRNRAALEKERADWAKELQERGLGYFQRRKVHVAYVREREGRRVVREMKRKARSAGHEARRVQKKMLSGRRKGGRGGIEEVERGDGEEGHCEMKMEEDFEEERRKLNGW